MRFTRNVANIVMDLNDVEAIDAKTLGGARQRHRQRPLRDRRRQRGGRPRRRTATTAADNVVVNATNGDDVATVAGAGSDRAGGRSVRPRLGVGRRRRSDRLTVNALAGDDVIDASGAGRQRRALLTLDGGDGRRRPDRRRRRRRAARRRRRRRPDRRPGQRHHRRRARRQRRHRALAANTVTSATRVGKGWLATHARIVKRQDRARGRQQEARASSSRSLPARSGRGLPLVPRAAAGARTARPVLAPAAKQLASGLLSPNNTFDRPSPGAKRPFRGLRASEICFRRFLTCANRERSDPSGVFASGICCRRFLTADSGACRDRTGDLRVANAALSHLS